MRDTRTAAVKLAGAGAVAILLATSAFAAAPGDQGGRYDNGRTQQNLRQDRADQAAARLNRGWQNQGGAQTGRDAQPTATPAPAVYGNRTAPQTGRDTQSNRGVYDNRTSQPNHTANDNGGARQGVYDNNRSLQGGTYDNRSQPAGTYDNRSQSRGTYDNRSSQSRGVYDNGGSQSRGTYDNRSTQPDRAYGHGSAYRENQRVNATGRITSFNRERDGYRVQLERGESYWIPQSRLGNHLRDLRVGISIGLGGIFRGGSVNIDAVSWPGDNGGYGYNQQGFVRGVVQGVDYRRDVVSLRDEASGRLIAVDLNGTRGSGELRRGDYVTLSGDWLRNGAFAAYRIDSVNGGRY